MLCAYLSATLLVGLGANALFGLWWADLFTALIASVAVKEGREACRAKHMAAVLPDLMISR